MTETPARLIFPVGHYLGPFHAVADSPPLHHVVRVGWTAAHLPDEQHVDVWGLVHGLPARIEHVRWTRAAVLAAADEVDLPDADATIDHLIELGVAVEVQPGTPQAVDFARSHRVQALLVGLGNTPDAAQPDGIGLIGLPPVVQVRPQVFEFWQLAQLWPTLWAGCEAFAQVARDQGDERAEQTDPEQILDYFLAALRILIAHNAVFLDVPR